VTEKQAWESIIDLIKAGLARNGMCGLVSRLPTTDSILIDMQGKIAKAVIRHRPKQRALGLSGAYMYPCNAKGNKQRIAWCRRQIAQLSEPVK
jgi:hypothetical protein